MRVPRAIRYPYRLLTKPVRRPGYTRFIMTLLTGSPRTVRGRVRTLTLLMKMYAQEGLSERDARQLRRLLNRYPEVAWDETISITVRDSRDVRHPTWWNKPNGGTHESS